MDADGSDPVQLTTNTDYDVQPAWSPDGTRIAYVTDADGDLEVVTMPATGGAATDVTTTAAGVERPAAGLGRYAGRPPRGKPPPRRHRRRRR